MSWPRERIGERRGRHRNQFSAGGKLDQVRRSPGRLLGGPRPTAESGLEDLWSLQEAGISMCAF